jgi:hypothetical protein
MNEQQRSENLTTADMAYGTPPHDQHDRVPADQSTRGQQAKEPAQASPLFSGPESQEYRSRWDRIQVSFVDEPRHAVEQADELVAATMKHLAEMFAKERATLEQQWSRGDQASTEDLRVALQRYRSFFDRLLAMQVRS